MYNTSFSQHINHCQLRHSVMSLKLAVLGDFLQSSVWQTHCGKNSHVEHSTREIKINKLHIHSLQRMNKAMETLLGA